MITTRHMYRRPPQNSSRRKCNHKGGSSISALQHKTKHFLSSLSNERTVWTFLGFCGVGMLGFVTIVLHNVANEHLESPHLGYQHNSDAIPHNSDAIPHNSDAIRPETAITNSYLQRINPRFLSGIFGRNKPIRSDEMAGIGDKSAHYRKLRQDFASLFPEEGSERRLDLVKSLRKNNYVPIKDFDNGEVDCPLHPPQGYPRAWPIMDIIDNWNPDDTTPHEKIYQGLCVFDYENDYEKIINYRNAELPFVIRNDPEVLRTVERWSHPDYLTQLLGEEPHRAEYSESNHFMYWMMKKNNNKKRMRGGPPKIQQPRGWKPPTEMLHMSYPDWLAKASVSDEELGPNKPHWYFRLIGCGAYKNCDKVTSEYLFDELPFFQPKESMYIVEPDAQRGIHCRFGMKGVIAENHWDGSRNMIALLSGERRYILSHPDQCQNLAILPKQHPSGRHSDVDWSNPTPGLEKYPEFARAVGNEMVLQPGDVMYLPTNWFHYIISLETNVQCNTRSGITSHYMKPIRDCGF